MKNWAVLFCIYILITGINICFSQNKKIEKDFSELIFNFGAFDLITDEGIYFVDENNTYTPETGFGLISTDSKNYDHIPPGQTHDKKIYTGLTAKDKIVFRIDLPPGKYLIETFMDGGIVTNWNGEILFNHQLIRERLIPFHVGFEGDDPPEYWTFINSFENKQNAVIVEIAAAQQPSTLALIRIYKDDIGPLVLENDRLMEQSPLRAPNAKLALELVNKGYTEEAQRVINAIPDNFRLEKAILLLAIAGRLECDDSRSVTERAFFILNEETKNSVAYTALNRRLARLFVDGDIYYNMAGWDWAGELTGQGIFTRIDLAGMNFEKISQIKSHPLYHQSLFRTAKVAYWGYIEQHNSVMLAYADSIFNLLQKIYPENRLLKMYSGELIPLETKCEKEMSNEPDWVNYTVKAMNSIKEIIHYWVDKRQANNGEFGGKYDDDVEMLRWWFVAILANADKKTLKGMQKLVDGIWDSYWIINGFSRKLRDVEHSSEPVADTQPMMIGLDYGNPVYVERCMQSIKGIRDIWTGVNKKGHRHFKSSWYSYKEIDAEPPRDCDVEMNTRTVKAARWLAWYNRHPFAIQFLKEWGDSWLEDCLRTDKDKPYGIVPAAIRFEDDAIGGHADNWHHPGMFWSYYDFNGGTQMLQQFLASYVLFKDDKYLEPLEEALKLITKYKDIDTDNAQTGSQEWVVNILNKSENFANTAELWRIITGNTQYDNVLKDMGSNYLKFLLTQDLKYLTQGSKDILFAANTNRELNTTEAYFTDRVEIRNLRSGPEYGASHLESMFSGCALYDSFYPFYNITWKGFDKDFAVVVLKATNSEIKLACYNTADVPKEGLIQFWSLEPGKYNMTQGNDLDNDLQIDEISLEKIISISARGDQHKILLPAGVMQIVTLKQIQKDDKITVTALADLAITQKEIQTEMTDNMFKIGIPVHNIGIADAKDISVRIIDSSKNNETIISEKWIEHIDAPLDLNAKIQNVEFSIPKPVANNIKIIIDAENKIAEINELNNIVSLVTHQ